MLIIKQLRVATDVHSIEKNTTEVNGDHQQFGYRHSSKYILCSTEERNGLEQHEGEYPFTPRYN